MRKKQNKINNQIKGEGLLTIYIQICGKHSFLHFPKDKREYTSYLLEEKTIISSIKEEGLFLHIFKTEKHEEKAAD